MERQEPGNVCTTSPSPRVRVEPAPTETKQEMLVNPDVLDASPTNCVNEEYNSTSVINAGAAKDNDMSVLDAEAVNINDVDEYHPEFLTPLQAAVVRPQSAIKTRSRTRVSVENVTLIHYALTQ